MKIIKDDFLRWYMGIECPDLDILMSIYISLKFTTDTNFCSCIYQQQQYHLRCTVNDKMLVFSSYDEVKKAFQFIDREYGQPYNDFLMLARVVNDNLLKTNLN